MVEQSTIEQKLAALVQENRNVLSFTGYTASTVHIDRKAAMIAKMPALNIPRNAWFTHQNWAGRLQMCPYHVHHRVNMQLVIKAVLSSLQANTLVAAKQKLNSAKNQFENELRQLHGHLSIEEAHYFPELKRSYPQFDLSFLEQDHEILYIKETALNESFSQCLALSSDSNLPDFKSQLTKVAEKLIEFDHSLMNHLGEEEETVTPLELCR